MNKRRRYKAKRWQRARKINEWLASTNFGQRHNALVRLGRRV